MAQRPQSFNADTSSALSPSHPTFSLPSSPSPLALPTSTPPLLRGRAKTLASLTTSSRNSLQADILPLELHLPKDPRVNGQPIEAYLYKDASECPICFLYYPPYLNSTRCCDQSICTECFVQIKRPDPHPPDHHDPASALAVEANEANDLDGDSNLVSEPAACPFCVQPEFGITYDPPPFRRGLIYANQPSAGTIAKASSAMSSSSSLSSVSGTGGLLSYPSAARRRTTSVSATSPSVITTDRVRPDWAQKLAGARAHAARRSAAATALHTAAYLMGNGIHGADSRGFGGFGRRGMLRRETGADSPSSGTGLSPPTARALLTGRYDIGIPREDMGTYAEHGPAMLAPPPRGSSRRNRIDDLEDMMMMEAIRLSLASEEERKKKEEKEAKKEAKKKEKEAKKVGKVAKKMAMYSNSASQSTLGLDGAAESILNESPTTQSKGKGVDRMGDAAVPSPLFDEANWSRDLTVIHQPDSASSGSQATENPPDRLERNSNQLQPSDARPLPSPYGREPQKPSHLRHISNASSSGSSFVESAPGSLRDGVAGSNSSFEISPNASGLQISRGNAAPDSPRSATPGGGAGTEPMFNFRSLAAMIDNKEKEGESAHIENTHDQDNDIYQGQNGEKSSNESPDHRCRGDDHALDQSTATLKAEVMFEGSTGEGTIDTPDVMVTSPSQVSLHQESKGRFKARERNSGT